jgi:Cu2+-exporting ATPase
VAGVQTVVLDKTGTPTEGKPSLTEIVAADEWTEEELLALAASAERNSEHPLARAIVEGAEQGRTPVFVAVDGRAAGLVAVADTVKPSSRANRRRALAAIGHRGGDDDRRQPPHRRGGRARAGHRARLRRGFARAEKAQHVAELQAEGKRVAMVGDGVNDAPALAQADIGIAIGAGADVAIETAKIVLMKSDPLDILRALTLSKATVRKMKQNLAWASVYNVLAIPIAAGALHPSLGIGLRPEWSALLMSLSSIIVAVNAVLLKRVDRELA